MAVTTTAAFILFLSFYLLGVLAGMCSHLAHAVMLPKESCIIAWDCIHACSEVYEFYKDVLRTCGGCLLCSHERFGLIVLNAFISEMECSDAEAKETGATAGDTDTDDNDMVTIHLNSAIHTGHGPWLLQWWTVRFLQTLLTSEV